MKKNLYIHIGMPKTGGTTIRTLIKENENLLLEKGIVQTRLHSIILNTHFDRIPRYTLKNEYKELSKIHLEEFYNKYKDNKKIHTYLINDDFFTNKGILSKDDIRYLANMIKSIFQEQEFNIKLIVYLRRQDYWVESLYINYVRVFYDKNFKDFIKFFQENDYLDYSKLLDIYAAEFGKSNLIVEIFDNLKKENSNNPLWESYLSKINCIDSELVKLGHNAFLNQKISYELIEFKKVLNSYLTDDEKWFYYSKLNQIAKDFNNTSYTYFSKRSREKLLTECLESNKYIAKKYLHVQSEELFSSEIKKIRKVKNSISLKEYTNIFLQLMGNNKVIENNTISNSRTISLFFNFIQSLKDNKTKYILYGYGSAGQIIKLILNKQIIAIVDQHSLKKINEFDYNYIILSPIGREEEIILELRKYNIKTNKIIKIKI